MALARACQNVKNHNRDEITFDAIDLMRVGSHVRRFHASVLPDAEVQFHLLDHSISESYLSTTNYQSHADAELLVEHFPIDDAHWHSARFNSYHSDCLCRVLDEWPTSRTKSSSRAQKVPFDRKPSFNAQHTRMGDICEVGTRIQSVMDRGSNPPLSSI